MYDRCQSSPMSKKQDLYIYIYITEWCESHQLSPVCIVSVHPHDLIPNLTLTINNPPPLLFTEPQLNTDELLFSKKIIFLFNYFSLSVFP